MAANCGGSTLSHLVSRLPLPPLTTGIDICSTARVRRILQHPSRGSQFVRRILAPDELRPAAVDRVVAMASASARARTQLTLPGSHGHATVSSALLDRATNFLAGRFAAKEAVFKAMHDRRLSFHDVIIVPMTGAAAAAAAESVEGHDTRKQQVAGAAHAHVDARQHAGGSNAGSAETSNYVIETISNKPKSGDCGGVDNDLREDLEGSYRGGPPIAVIRRQEVAQISISHDGDYAVASCVAWRGVASPPVDKEQHAR